MEVLRNPVPLVPFTGNGGLCSAVRCAPTSVGRGPGCEEDRLLPVTRPREDTPGNEEDVDLDPDMDPVDAVESAGEDERDVGGADDFVVLR